MKIIIFNSLYYPYQIGGAEISVQLLAEELSKDNSVTVVTLGERSENVFLNGVNVIRWKTPNIYNFFNLKKRKKYFKIIWHLIDSFNPISFLKAFLLIFKKNPDVIHYNNLSGFSPSIILSGHILKKKSLYTLRDYYILCHKTTLFSKGKVCDKLCAQCKITKTIKSLSLKRNQHFACLSHGQFKIISKHRSIKNYSIIPNGFKYDNPEHFFNNKKVDIKLSCGFLGRGIEEKGYFYLIDEFKGLNEDLIELHFGGMINEDVKLRRNNFYYHGFVKPSAFFKLIDILIVPSIWLEPFGRVVIEALHHHVKVICSNKAGLEDFKNLAGVKVIDIKPGVLKTEIERFLIEKDKKIFINEAFFSKFSIHTITKLYLNQYQTL